MDGKTADEVETSFGIRSLEWSSRRPSCCKGEECKVFHGRALVVLRSSDAPGQIALTAIAPGLETGAITVQTKRPAVR